MNQEKIGKFIFQLRKEKNMTQQELATKIGVTDRAVSKWENGRGLPDLSLLKALCDALNITINDLLSGERVDKSNYKDRLEENIWKTITYSNKEIKTNKKTFKIIVISFFIVSLIFIIMFLIDLKRMNDNKTVIFSTWGFKYTPAIELDEIDINYAVRDYLIKKGNSEPKHHEGEKTFVSMRVYLLEEIDDRTYLVYAWVMSGRYYLDAGNLLKDSGASMPYCFKVVKRDQTYEVVSSSYPRDGAYYPEDMNNIFPSRVREDIDSVYLDGTIEKLSKELEEQAILYFHK